MINFIWQREYHSHKILISLFQLISHFMPKSLCSHDLSITQTISLSLVATDASYISLYVHVYIQYVYA